MLCESSEDPMKKTILITALLACMFFLLTGCKNAVMGSNILTNNLPEDIQLSESAEALMETYRDAYKKADKTIGTINSRVDQQGSDVVFMNMTDVTEDDGTITVTYKTLTDVMAYVCVDKQTNELISLEIKSDEPANDATDYIFTAMLTIKEMQLEGKDIPRLAHQFFKEPVSEDLYNGYHVETHREPDLLIQLTRIG